MAKCLKKEEEKKRKRFGINSEWVGANAVSIDMLFLLSTTRFSVRTKIKIKQTENLFKLSTKLWCY